MTAPLFSIIMPTHERPALLLRALRSLRDQDFPSLEIIIVSDEGSAETATNAQSLLTDRDIFIKRNGPAGPARSRNLGVSLASGSYIIFLDDDDTLSPGLLRHLADTVGPASNVIYFWDYETVLEDRTSGGAIIRKHSIPTLLDCVDTRAIYLKNKLPNHVMALPRHAVERLPFDERLRSLEDWDFLLGLLNSGLTLSRVPVLGSQYFNDVSAVHRNPTSNQMLIPDYLSIYRKWPAPDDQIRLQRRNMLAEAGMEVPFLWL